MTKNQKMALAAAGMVVGTVGAVYLSDKAAKMAAKVLTRKKHQEVVEQEEVSEEEA